MSNAPRSERSFRRIDADDLARLASVATTAIDDLCQPPNKSSIYRGHLAVLCLCQGAALHHQQTQRGDPVEDQRGIHDFDVWGFFRPHAEMAFPWRWRGEVDFGQSHFGRRPEDGHLVGRKVDILGRSIPFQEGERAPDAVIRWVRGGGASPKAIRQRPIYVISPGDDFGSMIWPGA